METYVCNGNRHSQILFLADFMKSSISFLFIIILLMLYFSAFPQPEVWHAKAFSREKKGKTLSTKPHSVSGCISNTVFPSQSSYFPLKPDLHVLHQVFWLLTISLKRKSDKSQKKVYGEWKGSVWKCFNNVTYYYNSPAFACTASSIFTNPHNHMLPTAILLKLKRILKLTSRGNRMAVVTCH